MEKAADILSAAMRQMNQPEAPLAWLAGAWATLVGDALASHTHPVALKAGALEIQTSGAEWQRQLEPLSRQFCEKINRAWGSGLVKELRFSTARPVAGTISKSEDNQYTPFVRTRGK
ncbi:MAG: DciA family protein [Candidatus Acidiferrales bacterium]